MGRLPFTRHGALLIVVLCRCGHEHVNVIHEVLVVACSFARRHRKGVQ